jgi:hypothetical protein
MVRPLFLLFCRIFGRSLSLGGSTAIPKYFEITPLRPLVSRAIRHEVTMNTAHPSDRIEKAQRFAENAHRGQTRKGDGAEPYVTHLAEVAELVTRFGGSETAILAAWLHDTVEDCATTRADLVSEFGEAVARVVIELTDDKSLPKPERKRLQIVNAPHKSPEAALVKLCDKMSNVRAVGLNPPVHWSLDRKRAYVDWAVAVTDALPDVPDLARMAFVATVQATRDALEA